VDVKPEVKIEGYKGLTVEQEHLEVTDEHVDAVLKRKQDEQADFLPVTDRPAAKGDWVLLEGKALLGDRVVRDLSGSFVEVGSDSLPGQVNEALVGSSPGDERTVNLGESGQQDSSNIVYRFTVKEIKEKSVLVLDDSFAKRAGNFQDLEQMKSDIRKQLTEFFELQTRQDLRRQVVEQLVDKVEVDVPESMVKSQVEYMKNLAQATGRNKTGGPDEDELKELAVRRIKEFFVIEEIGRKENITVTDEEVNRVKENVSKTGSGSEPDADRIRSNLQSEKVLDYLVENANIREKEKSRIVKPDEVSLIRRGEK